MSTIVFLHAHPDDETSQTAGMMALAARAGHRVVTVFGTNGDHGQRPEELGDDGDLVEHRRGEARAAARVLGVERVDWLGYRDSGMTGWDQNSDPLCLHQAMIDESGSDEAAGRLARILDREDADVLVGYDYRGNYGHPDHLAVHRLARRAVDLAARRPRLLEAAGNRTAQMAMLESEEAARFLAVLAESGIEVDVDNLRDMILTGDDGLPVGVLEEEIDWTVDLPEDVIELKRSAMGCHASQTSDIGLMLRMPADLYALSFGTEYLIEPDLSERDEHRDMRRAWPFD